MGRILLLFRRLDDRFVGMSRFDWDVGCAVLLSWWLGYFYSFRFHISTITFIIATDSKDR